MVFVRPMYIELSGSFMSISGGGSGGWDIIIRCPSSRFVESKNLSGVPLCIFSSIPLMSVDRLVSAVFIWEHMVPFEASFHFISTKMQYFGVQCACYHCLEFGGLLFRHRYGVISRMTRCAGHREIHNSHRTFAFEYLIELILVRFDFPFQPSHICSLIGRRWQGL